MRRNRPLPIDRRRAPGRRRRVRVRLALITRVPAKFSPRRGSSGARDYQGQLLGARRSAMKVSAATRPAVPETLPLLTVIMVTDFSTNSKVSQSRCRIGALSGASTPRALVVRIQSFTARPDQDGHLRFGFTQHRASGSRARTMRSASLVQLNLQRAGFARRGNACVPLCYTPNAKHVHKQRCAECLSNGSRDAAHQASVKGMPAMRNLAKGI